LWDSAVSVVPLRIGGGTRLKIYEAMAAKIPVVSTTVGAEGLDIRNGEDIYIADSAAEFAGRCLELLENSAARRRMAGDAFRMVSSRYSWEVVSRKFEDLLV
jgi:glycosyltransferase involved in cell wall biosynthesis